jgi:hypothetical protein
MVNGRAIIGFGYLPNRPQPSIEKPPTKEQLSEMTVKNLKQHMAEKLDKKRPGRKKKDELVNLILQLQERPHEFNELLVPQPGRSLHSLLYC